MSAQYGPTKACFICHHRPRLAGSGHATCGSTRCRRELVAYRRGLRPQYDKQEAVK